MNERVRMLREQSLQATPHISMERARLETEVYREHGDSLPAPLLRARVFEKIMQEKTIAIPVGELIVGERGECAGAVPTFPELCCHSEQDLDTMHHRERISFKVSPEARWVHKEEIMPYWEKRALRPQILEAMTPAWHDCYAAGVFTEFMEQRGPGHTVADNRIYQKGFRELQQEIQRVLEQLDDEPDKQAELEAMLITTEAIITLGRRYADLAEELASRPEHAPCREDLETIAAVCRRVPAEKPRTFHEALQMYWFVHVGVITEMNNWDAFNPGRLDQHLIPFYRRERANGTLDEEQAKELLQCFWIKFNNHPAPPKVGITLKESGTYTDFANINSGGLTADGEDGVNEVTWLVLDVIDGMRLLQPSSNMQVSAKNPDAFVDRAARIARKGWGQPSFFNADAVIEEMLRMGKTIEDARCGGTSGCVETGAFGKEAFILTGYFNLPKVLEITLNQGKDPLTGNRIGLDLAFHDFDGLLDAFRRQLQHFVDIKIAGNDVIEQLYADQMPVPFLSTIIADCIENATDYNAGGARYNTRYLQGVGIGTITDCLAALRKHVYDDRAVSPEELMQALADDFEGHARLRAMLCEKSPKYGNDDPEADGHMVEVFNAFFEAVDGRSSALGARYAINLLPTTCHIYFGSVIGATPDGRKACQPLPEGISPSKGADRKGPTAVLRSAAKMPHLKTGGTLLNQKFLPQVLEGERGIRTLSALIRTYFRMHGHHIQFNVVDRATLREAQEKPEEYKDLIVRVAGYSDYFNNLEKPLQDEIIARTEQGSMA